MTKVEAYFGCRFPADYVLDILSVGLPRTTAALLHSIVEQNLDAWPVGDFYSPAEIIEETEGWRPLGLPHHYVAFANDGAGNKFCFEVGESPAVWFFDHDSGTMRSISPTWTAWIEAFCSIEPSPEN